MIISSLENEKVKKYIKLSKKKYREEYGQFIVEGIHSVREAYKAGVLDEVLVRENNECEIDCKAYYVTEEVMKKISSVDTPQTVMGVCHKKGDIDNDRICKRILILDRLQDPGNLGTIIRSACAFGIDTIVLSENTVDVYNSKVLRATQGMIFHINIIQRNILDFIDYLKDNEYNVYGTNVVNGEDVRNLDSNMKDKFALIVGNEGSGVREEVSLKTTKNLYIKMNESVESLNVAIATSILLYELGR